MSIDVFRALILGVIQGLTEFLPISSSGHLALTPQLLGWPPFGLTFDVATHLGTLAAVLWYFRAEWVGLARGFFSRAPEWAMQRRLAWAIAIACVPAVIAGVLLEEKAETVFRSGEQIAALMIGMGIVMGIVDRIASRRRRLEEMGWRDALLIGVAQAMALAPGVSRSGATITAGLLAGYERADAARFSFLLSAPITAGAVLFKLRHLITNGIPAHEQAVFAAGILSSLVVGYLAIAGLLSYLRRYGLGVFVAYRIVFGVVALLLLARQGS